MLMIIAAILRPRARPPVSMLLYSSPSGFVSAALISVKLSRNSM